MASGEGEMLMLANSQLQIASETHAGDSSHLIGVSPALSYVLFRVGQVAPTDATVLLLGETGTGKGLVAAAIHERSRRRHHKFMAVNCAALPANLIESELFGRERGAFTDARFSQAGRFELANGGTIFLDEIGELPLETQAKLLRVLQDGHFERLGSPRTIRVDARVIAATNRHIVDDVRSGRFRADLYHRLNVFPISLPPLRERREDIDPLLRHFLDRQCARYGKPIPEVPIDVSRELRSYTWPGNVRELENVVERAVITSDRGVLRLAEPLEGSDPLATAAGGIPTLLLNDVERHHITRVLRAKRWCVEGRFGAAAALGLKASTLRSRMRKLGISRPVGADG
jgi:transcriptional regulator with GAF, ATPase, and Fis domain